MKRGHNAAENAPDTHKELTATCQGNGDLTMEGTGDPEEEEVLAQDADMSDSDDDEEADTDNEEADSDDDEETPATPPPPIELPDRKTRGLRLRQVRPHPLTLAHQLPDSGTAVHINVHD